MSDPRFDRDDAPLPSWTGRSAAASVSLHTAVLLVLIIITVLPSATEQPAMSSMREIARIELPADDPPIAIDKAIPPEQLSGYEVSGLPFNLAKIAARRASLFPFLTADLSFLERMSNDLRSSSAHLTNPLDRALMAQPLELEDSTLQQVIDESWSRRDRWQRFQQVTALLVGHDGNEGRAPSLVRAYLDQNLLQPFCDGKSKDGQFWTLLENAADHADFLEFIRRYARTRSSSRTTTELLFLVDELAQGNREVALNVIGTSVSHDLAQTAVQSPHAALLAARIGNDLRAWFAAHRLSPRTDLRDAYDRFRLRVLSTIIETAPNGYRAADARFLAGEIFYRKGDTTQALEWWGPMKPVEGDTYAEAARAIQKTLARPEPLDAMALYRIIATESAKWSELNYARLKHFGYRCDSY